MNKTEWIELFHNIKSTIISFIAILLFIACAVSLYLGIHWTINALSLSLNNEYTEGNMYSYKVESNIGLTKSMLDEIKKSEYVDSIESFNQTYRFFNYKNEPYQAKILSLSKIMNTPLRINGNLPKVNGEAAIDSHFAKEKGVNLGDRLSLKTNEFVNSLGLYTDEVTITAIIDVSEYLGKYDDTNGFSYASYANVNTILFLPDESFNEEVFHSSFSFYIKSNLLDKYDTLSSEYESNSDMIKKDIEDRINNTLSKNLGLDTSFIKKNYTITERNKNASLFGFKCVRDTFEKMQYSLVLLFIIISLLVCYSTISRLVYEGIKLIGMKKAQGFSTFKILLSYIIYSEFAGIIGIFLGILGGYFLVEPITINSVKQTFLFGKVITYLNIKDIILISLAIFILIFITVFIAGYKISSKKAYNLLMGEEKPRRHHKFLDRFKLSTYTKSAINGCFEDKRRIIATIIGVIGCTSLVTSALTMYLNLDKSFKTSFSEIINYDKTILYEDPSIESRIENILIKKDYKYTKTLYTLGTTLLDNGENIITTIYVIDDDSFYNMINFDSTDNSKIILNDGILVNASYAKNNNKGVGDTLKFTDALGLSHDFKIDGIYNYYLMNYQVIMKKSTFSKEFSSSGITYQTNMFLINTDKLDFDKFKLDFSNIDGITSIRDYYDEEKNLFDGFLIIARAISLVYLLLSILLAIFILLNLYTMFIFEKKNEVITLMINGYDRKKIEKYFYIDTTVLTIIGIIIGTIVGVINGKTSLESFNNNATYFINNINIIACIIGVIFSLLLSFIMLKISLKKIKEFKCSDINTM